MNEINEKIEHLEKRLANLVKTQINFQQEITQIRRELANIRHTAEVRPLIETNQPPTSPSRNKINTSSKIDEKQPEAAQPPPREYFPNSGQPQDNNRQDDTKTANQMPVKSNLERFVGENLLSKIGIVVLVLGVAIGAKYAIDRDLISPLMRIVSGYAFGFGILGFAFKLKEKYLNFSAVLLSGAMAIMYFITFFAYSLYGLFPQPTAFVLMLIFTVFTVVSALLYNRQVIAQIGLVGAYAIPFLLSNDSGKYAFLFAYIAIINVGILAVSVKKYWRSLHFSSFIVTWLIYSGWFATKYQTDENFNLALLFLTINFLTFYITFIIYKVINLKHVAVENISLILANSFIFYGFGYAILDGRAGFDNYLGTFTVLNAAIHFAVAFTVSRLKLVAQDLIYLLSALIITFATIAVPVQLDGNFVTLIWAVEAAILFWIGRTKTLRIFEIYSFPLMLMASISLVMDWFKVVESRDLSEISAISYPFYNGNFFTSLFFAAAFFFIFLTNRIKHLAAFPDENLREIVGTLTLVFGIFVFYNAFRIEIGNYFHFLTLSSAVRLSDIDYQKTDQGLVYFNMIWQLNYTMLFLTVLSFFNIRKVKYPLSAFVNLILNALIFFIFATFGLFLFSRLREMYLLQIDAELFSRGVFYIFIRYISYIFAASLILASFLYLKQDYVRAAVKPKTAQTAFDISLFVPLLLILSSELLNWMDIYDFKDSYKLGLSILWGIYALFLIALGIYNHKKHLRIGAIILFGITLAKLFFYDISALDTISKTIVFVSLGILLLIVSFLYNKYKLLIFGDESG